MDYQSSQSGIVIGKKYRHKYEGGLVYKTQTFIINATGYEVAHTVTNMVVYEQLERGTYPIGTRWVREVGDFLNNFEIVENE